MITKEQVEHIAKLANILLSKEEIEKFQKDLSDVLDYFETLKEANTDGVEPMTHSIQLENQDREDVAKECKDAKEILKSADPRLFGRLLKVSSIQKQQ